MKEKALLLGPDNKGRYALCIDDHVVSFGAAPANLDKLTRIELPAGAQILGGDVCAHTHLYSGLVPLGMPAPEQKPENFLQILERVWWRLDRALDAETLRASARYYVANALLAGTTSLVDHHESPNFIEGSLDVLADACQDLGARALVCYGATDRNGGLDEGRRGLEECRRFIKSNERPLVRGLYGLHASFTVSDETVKLAAQMCAEDQAKMHVHVAEDAADVADAKTRGYLGPYERLHELGAMPARSLVIHGIHMPAHTTRAADQADMWLVQNPRSNHGNEVGYARNLRFAQRVALGTDGYPALMADELAFLREQNERFDESSFVADARLASGWRLMSDYFNTTIGPMVEVDEPNHGLRADLKVVDKEGKVLHVIVDGEFVVKDGELVNGEVQTITAEAKEAAEKLWREMAKY